MSTAPQRAARVAVGKQNEQHEWLDKQTANDAEMAEAMATYNVTYAAHKVPPLAKQSQHTNRAHTQGVDNAGSKQVDGVDPRRRCGGFARCVQRRRGADDEPAVGVALPTKEQARWVADGSNLHKQFTSLGYDVDHDVRG